MKLAVVIATHDRQTWQYYQPWTPSVVYKIRASINTNPRTVVTPNLLSLVVPNLLSSGCNSLANSKPMKTFLNCPPSHDWYLYDQELSIWIHENQQTLAFWSIILKSDSGITYKLYITTFSERIPKLLNAERFGLVRNRRSRI